MPYIPWVALEAADSYKGLGHYIDNVEASADRWYRKAAARIAKHADDDDELQELRELVNQELHEDILPRLSRYSCLLALCAVNEASIAALCRVVDRRLGHPKFALPQPLLEPFPGTAFKYLKEVLNWPATAGRFQSRLAALQHVRNCIAHADGAVGSCRRPEVVRNAAKQFKFLVRGRAGMGRVEIPRGSLSSVIEECAGGFADLYASVHEPLRDGKPPKKS